jgi:hypothetical protein
MGSRHEFFKKKTPDGLKGESSTLRISDMDGEASTLRIGGTGSHSP